MLATTLARARILLRGLDKMRFSVGESLDDFERQLKHWQARAEAFSRHKLGEPKRHDADDKHFAAQLAAELMTIHDLSLKVSRKPRSCSCGWPPSSMATKRRTCSRHAGRSRTLAKLKI